MRKLLIAAFLVLNLSPAKGQTFNPNLAAMLQDTLDTYVSLISNIKGMSAGVYLPGQGIWKGTSGLSYAGQAITPEMEFGIASNTKLFVSTVLLKLQENNLLSLEDSLHEWLPAYSNVNPDITIRQLLNHTSGISDPIFLPPHMDTIMANPTRVFTPNEVLGWLGAPFFTAGTSWGYSNINYILAGMVAESATGFHISQLIRDSLLTPLNLDSTFYDVEESAIGTLAHRWFNTVDFHDTSRVGLNSAGGCAGALFSTPSEMVQWYHGLMSGQLLNQNSLAEMTDFVPTGSPTSIYGLGISEDIVQGKTFWGHGGSTWGYKSKMVYDTCSGAVVCGLANSFPAGMDGIAFLLWRVLVNHLPDCGAALSGLQTVCQGDSGITYTVTPIANSTSYSWILPNGATGTSNTNSITVSFGLASVSGEISVSGVNNYGAGSPAVLSVTVNAKPPAPTITQIGNVLQSSAPAGNQWYDSSGLLPGETNQTFNLIANDTYYVIVTIAGCNSDSSNHLHAQLTGIYDPDFASGSKVFPNPFSDEVTLAMAHQEGKIEYSIVNSLGQIADSGFFSGSLTLNLGYLPAGIYSLKLSSGGQTLVRKLVKQ